MVSSNSHSDVALSSIEDHIRPSLALVNQYDRDLTFLSKWWSKISLIGKINSHDVAYNILEDMDSTFTQFNELKTILIANLTREHVKEILMHDIARCQMIVDVLIRNLFERTADIGFLASDSAIVNFLSSDNHGVDSCEYIRERLQSYVTIYSVYKDAALISPQGDVLCKLSGTGCESVLREKWFTSALNNPNDYIEVFDTSVLTATQNKELRYAQAVVSSGKVIGVVVLVFRFRDEMAGILKSIRSSYDTNEFLLLDEAGHVIYKPESGSALKDLTVLKLHSPIQKSRFNHCDVCVVSAVGQAYQGYEGPLGWQACSVSSLDDMSKQKESVRSDLSKNANDLPKSIISNSLLSVRDTVTSINASLQLIIMNGIITAARERAVEFVPVLESIKDIGHQIEGIFTKSISSLFKTITTTQLKSLQLQAVLAVDIMDRNLYERANDCRWWALNQTLCEALSSSVIDGEAVKKTLKNIHSLYTVYHTLYVYDEEGRYIAFSCDGYTLKKGQRVEDQSGIKSAMSLNSIYEYSVSPFTHFDCYDGQSTYIYNAPIREGNRILGGVGIVFDSTDQFRKILCDVLPNVEMHKNVASYSLFTDEHGVIISSSTDSFSVGSSYSPPIDLSTLDQQGSLSRLLRWNQKTYLIGVAKSQGYREYKRSDGYKNTLLAWVVICTS